MKVLISCPNCGQALRVEDTSVGKTVACPKCKDRFVARGEEPIEPVEAIRPAAPPPRPKPAAEEVTTRRRPRDEDLEEVEPAERPRRRPVRRRSFDPIDFNVVVRSDTEKEFKGQCKAQLDEEGLHLMKGKKKLLIPVGSRARIVKGNRIEIELDDRVLDLVISKCGIYLTRLTKDVVAFLKGKLDELYIEDYRMPWYLYLPAILPLGIPILTLGGALPCALGFGLAGGCAAIAQQDRWPIGARIAVQFGLTVLGYLILIILAVAVHVVSFGWAR